MTDEDRPDETAPSEGDEARYPLADEPERDSFAQRRPLHGPAPVEPLHHEHTLEAGDRLETYRLRIGPAAEAHVEPQPAAKPPPLSTKPPERSASPVAPRGDDPRPTRKDVRRGGLSALVVGCVLIFVTGLSFTMLSLAAPRVVAKHVGLSVHASTSVAGVLLAGVAIGGGLGGWLAERVPNGRTLPWTLFAASVFTAAAPLLDEVVAGTGRGNWSWEAWTVWVAGVLFLAPAAAVGTAFPLVAHRGLVRSRRPGVALGGMLAAAALGAIAGTWLTVFVLVDRFGTKSTIFLAAGALAVTAAFVVGGRRVFRTAVCVGWLPFLAILGLVTTANADAARDWGERLGGVANALLDGTERHRTWGDRSARIGGALHELGLATSLRSDRPGGYRDESRYQLVRVGESGDSGAKVLWLDARRHGTWTPNVPRELPDAHDRVAATVVEAAAGDASSPLHALCLGGGTYAFPRWLASRFPNAARVDVVEVDPAVRRAAEREFGLQSAGASPIATHVLDPRNHLHDLLRENRRRAEAGRAPLRYDVVRSDLFRDRHPPWHLSTLEFTRDVHSLLSDDGVYLVALSDAFPRTEAPTPVVGEAETEFRGALPVGLLAGELEVGASAEVERFPLVVTRRTAQRFALRVPEPPSPSAIAELRSLGRGNEAFVAAVESLQAAARERVAYRGRVPDAIADVAEETGRWSPCPAPFAGLEVLRTGDGFLFGVRGAMTDALRSNLRDTAADNPLFLEVVDDLWTRSRRPTVGRFLGRLTATTAAVFPHVSVFAVDGASSTQRAVFLVAGSRQPLDADALADRKPLATVTRDESGGRATSGLAGPLLALSEGRLLTDDSAPVAVLLAPLSGER